MKETSALERIEAFMQRDQERRQLFGTAGRLDRVVESGGGEFRYEYDKNGDLTGLSEANGRTKRYVYDARRRLASVDHSAGLPARYRYDDRDRLDTIDDRGMVTQYGYDSCGRVVRIQHGQADVSVYRYDDLGRVVLARTSQVTTRWEYDAAGRTNLIEQSIGGVTLTARFYFDAAGRLAALTLPGSERPVRYTWDDRGRPQTVSLDQKWLARFHYDDTTKTTTLGLCNGITAESAARMADGRPWRQTIRRDADSLLERTLIYNDAGAIIGDGERRYRYDLLGRLVGAEDDANCIRTSFAYDELDNLVERIERGNVVRSSYDEEGRLLSATDGAGERVRFAHDGWGRLTDKASADAAWSYRFDDAGQLQEVRRDHERVARFLYDHKGRLAWAEVAGHVERYLYGAADELLAVTDAAGRPVRLPVRTPLGVPAEVCGAIGDGAVIFRHDDERGTTRLLTNSQGEIVARFAYDPFGQPIVAGLGERPNAPGNCTPCFMGRSWFPEIGLYYFGARWYDPAHARFLTPDSYSGAPDDARLLNPLHPASRQAALRGQILGEWLKQPRVRNPYAFCGNDPIGRVDPNGHWSFGGVMLMLLGAIWTLPNTLFGILVEITCLVGEVIRWLVWLFSAGNVSWQTPGFDAAASGNLNAFALVFTGGWLGSFSNLLGITFGNVFFVYKEWSTSHHITSLPDPIRPSAYGGSVAIPRDQMLYEHELRHTNQYGWLGPFFHLGLPLFGFYEWDVIINGYQDAWTERDARAHAEP
jgi:RHS repeat-associated protein